uniref:Complexin n=1 Tax=Glossina palpalis gambiensis TaxID=67801 RepID=A0A1B0B508_9MUSC
MESFCVTRKRAVGGDGGDGEDDKEKAEEEERERQEAIREAEERRKEKHRRMEEEREKMRQDIRDKYNIKKKEEVVEMAPQEEPNPLMRRKKTPEELAAEAEQEELDDFTSRSGCPHIPTQLRFFLLSFSQCSSGYLHGTAEAVKKEKVKTDKGDITAVAPPLVIFSKFATTTSSNSYKEQTSRKYRLRSNTGSAFKANKNCESSNLVRFSYKLKNQIETQVNELKTQIEGKCVMQ